LLDLIFCTSELLVNNLYGPPLTASTKRRTFTDDEALRAADLAIRNPTAKKVMEELGLWQFKSIV
jgi:hypothetical protein